MQSILLKFEFQSDWHIGNGKEAGAYADALALKDNLDLPYIPGKSIKGLLRQAFDTACENKWFGEQSSALMGLLFGEEKREGEYSQGLLQFSSAKLSHGEQAYFKQNNQAKKHLYRTIQSTAIEHTTGVAKEGSLRSMEVVVPMVLIAEVSVNQGHPNFSPELANQEQITTYLAQASQLVTALGAKRNRGLGQVTISVLPQGGE